MWKVERGGGRAQMERAGHLGVVGARNHARVANTRVLTWEWATELCRIFNGL